MHDWVVILYVAYDWASGLLKFVLLVLACAALLKYLKSSS